MAKEEKAAGAVEEPVVSKEAGAPEEVSQKIEPCNRCGFSEEAEAVPLEADMEAYLRCVLGNQPFEKEYELYDGKIQLRFRTINNREVDALNNLLFKMEDSIDRAVIQDKSIKLRLLYFLAHIKLSDKEADYEIPNLKDTDKIDEEFNSRFGACSETVIRMMSQTLMLFIELQGLLISQGFDENFWKGAGLRSR